MLYTFLRALAKYLIAPFFPVKLVGEKELPEGVMVCSNHISNWDPIFIAVAVKSKLHFMAKAELFRFKITSWFFRKINVFPVKRGGNDLSAIKDSIKIIKSGKRLALFPEGTRKMDASPNPSNAKAGLGLIAANTGVDIIPVAVYNKYYRVRLFRTVYIIVGDKIPKDEYLKYSDGDKKKIAEYVFIKINEEIKSFESEQKSRKKGF